MEPDTEVLLCSALDGRDLSISIIGLQHNLPFVHGWMD